MRCDDEHFLDSSGRMCVEHPKGIDFCRTYESEDVCTECQSNYYPKDKKCAAVDKANMIPGCYTYDEKQKCLDCQDDQFWIDGNCLSILAKNCLTFQSEKECKTCDFGFELL